MPGTDGQNVASLGALAAFGINDEWSFFLGANAVNTWDKGFDTYNGFGISVAPLLVYSPDWWAGAYVQLWPNYTRFLTDELSGSGAGNIDATVGGQFSEKVWWAATYQHNVDEDLRSFRRGEDTGLTNDWNLFFSVTTYF